MQIINPKRFHPNITQNAIENARTSLQALTVQLEQLYLKCLVSIATIEDAEQLALLSEELDRVNQQLLHAIDKMAYMF